MAQKMKYDQLSKVLRHCPLSEYFGYSDSRYGALMLSRQRALYLVSKMLAQSAIITGFADIEERGVQSERSETCNDGKARPLKVINPAQ